MLGEKLCNLMDPSSRFWVSTDLPRQMLWLTQWDSLVNSVRFLTYDFTELYLFVWLVYVPPWQNFVPSVYYLLFLLYLVSSVRCSAFHFKFKLNWVALHVHSTHTLYLPVNYYMFSFHRSVAYQGTAWAAAIKESRTWTSQHYCIGTSFLTQICPDPSRTHDGLHTWLVFFFHYSKYRMTTSRFHQVWQWLLFHPMYIVLEDMSVKWVATRHYL